MRLLRRFGERRAEICNNSKSVGRSVERTSMRACEEVGAARSEIASLSSGLDMIESDAIRFISRHSLKNRFTAILRPSRSLDGQDRAGLP